LLEGRSRDQTYQEFFDLGVAMRAPDQHELVRIELRGECVSSSLGGRILTLPGSGRRPGKYENNQRYEKVYSCRVWHLIVMNQLVSRMRVGTLLLHHQQNQWQKQSE
jgi:hypothetical protein